MKSVCEAEKQISRQLNGLKLMWSLRRKIDSRIHLEKKILIFQIRLVIEIVKYVQDININVA